MLLLHSLSAQIIGAAPKEADHFDLSLLPTFATAAIGQQTNPAESSTIRLNVNLILVHVTVSEQSGHIISGLQKQAFRLFVDGVQRSITVFQADDAPLAAGILVDNSASMTSKGSEVRAAALAFARASNRQDQMFVVHFNDQVRLGLPPETPFTANVSELEKALARFDATGTTALYDALGLALAQLRRAELERRVLLLISDGGDNSSRAQLADVLKTARESGYAIYSIGIYDNMDRDRNPRILSELAELTGGKAFFPAERKEVTTSCEEIARDIRRQYTLGFEGEEDGQYHHIKVTAQDPNYSQLAVRARAGYFAPKPSGSGSAGH